MVSLLPRPRWLRWSVLGPMLCPIPLHLLGSPGWAPPGQAASGPVTPTRTTWGAGKPQAAPWRARLAPQGTLLQEAPVHPNTGLLAPFHRMSTLWSPFPGLSWRQVAPVPSHLLWWVPQSPFHPLAL